MKVGKITQLTTEPSERHQPIPLMAHLGDAHDKIKELRAALSPFCFGDATMEEILFGKMSDDEIVNFTVKLKHCRAARKALDRSA